MPGKQTSCISGRTITENNWLIYDIVYYTYIKNIPGSNLLMDFVKSLIQCHEISCVKYFIEILLQKSTKVEFVKMFQEWKKVDNETQFLPFIFVICRYQCHQFKR